MKPGAKVVKEIRAKLAHINRKRVQARLTNPLRTKLYLMQTVKAIQENA